MLVISIDGTRTADDGSPWLPDPDWRQGESSVVTREKS
jgi:hypothetical protein